MSRLEAAGRRDETRITVSFHPALPEGHSAERTPAVRIGRVYVTHGWARAAPQSNPSSSSRLVLMRVATNTRRYVFPGSTGVSTFRRRVSW